MAAADLEHAKEGGRLLLHRAEAIEVVRERERVHWRLRHQHLLHPGLLGPLSSSGIVADTICSEARIKKGSGRARGWGQNSSGQPEYYVIHV